MTLKIANETWILDTKGLKKFEILRLIICFKIIFSCQKWNWNFQNLCISSDFWRQIFGNIRAKYSNIRIIFSFLKLHRIEYEYQYSEENIRIFVRTLVHIQYRSQVTMDEDASACYLKWCWHLILGMKSYIWWNQRHLR